MSDHLGAKVYTSLYTSCRSSQAEGNINKCKIITEVKTINRNQNDQLT